MADDIASIHPGAKGQGPCDAIKVIPFEKSASLELQSIPTGRLRQDQPSAVEPVSLAQAIGQTGVSFGRPPS